MTLIIGVTLFLFLWSLEPLLLRLWPQALSYFPGARKTVRIASVPARPADAHAGYRDPGLAEGTLVVNLPQRVAIGRHTLRTVTSGGTYLLHPSALLPPWIVRIEVTRDGEHVEIIARRLLAPVSLLIFMPMSMAFGATRGVPFVMGAVAFSWLYWAQAGRRSLERRRAATEAALDLFERSLAYAADAEPMRERAG